MKDKYKELDSLYKLRKSLSVKIPGMETKEVDTVKDSKDKNTSFLKRVKEDIYIDETVRVMNEMILQSNMAKKP